MGNDKEDKTFFEYAEEREAGEMSFYDETITVAQNMRKYGGSFVNALGTALSHADMNNTMKIKQAFPEYWEEYKKM